MNVTSARRSSSALRAASRHGVRVDGEIDAEEQHDQECADGAEHRDSDRGGAARDVPGAELAEQLGDIEILQQLLLVRRIHHLLQDLGDPVATLVASCVTRSAMVGPSPENTATKNPVIATTTMAS